MAAAYRMRRCFAEIEKPGFARLQTEDARLRRAERHLLQPPV